MHILEVIDEIEDVPVGKACTYACCRERAVLTERLVYIRQYCCKWPSAKY